MFLAGAGEHVADARDAGDLDQLSVQPDRLTDCAAVALAYGPTPGVFDRCVRALRVSFGNNILETARQPLRLAAGHAMRLESLHPDGVVKEESLITVICRFDFLTNALSIWSPDGNRPAEVSLPYYAAWDSEWVRPTVTALVLDNATRQTLIPGASDESLANLLQLLADRADRGSQGLGSWPFWSGFADARIQRFIGENATSPPSG